MCTIDLAYAGLGLHEELVAYVADQEGYYEAEGVHVAIRDGVSWETECLRRGATIGLGRTLLSRLTDGILNPDRDATCVVRFPGDYQMDVRRLRDGSIDAAYVGSTLSPEQVVKEEGFNLLAWVGDHFQIPTVGVAVDPAHIPLDSPAARSGAGQPAGPAHDRRTTPPGRRLHRRVPQHLTRDEAHQYYERYVGPYFTADGQVDLDIAQNAIDAVAAELGVASVSATEVYQRP